MAEYMTLQEYASYHYAEPVELVWDADHWHVQFEDGSRATFNSAFHLPLPDRFGPKEVN